DSKQSVIPKFFKIGSEHFLVTQNKVNWATARRLCNESGGSLAEPEDLFKLHMYLMKYHIAGNFWIGGSDAWLSGENFNKKWINEKFTKKDYEKNCLLFNISSFSTIRDHNCYQNEYYICEQIVNYHEDDFIQVGSQNFLVVEEMKSWSAARKYCHSLGGDLAQPNNLLLLQNNLDTKNLSGSDYWLGGSDIENEGEWIWLSGANIKEKWRQGQPGGYYAENCLDFQSLGVPSLNDYECNSKLKFICEKL
ncbi:unnamed protein product, partial [Meganyctiphanes norvegica]